MIIIIVKDILNFNIMNHYYFYLNVFFMRVTVSNCIYDNSNYKKIFYIVFYVSNISKAIKNGMNDRFVLYRIKIVKNIYKIVFLYIFFY